MHQQEWHVFMRNGPHGEWPVYCQERRFKIFSHAISEIEIQLPALSMLNLVSDGSNPRTY